MTPDPRPFGVELNEMDQLSLLDPERPTIGKFQRPGDAAPTQIASAIMAYPASGTQRRKVLNAIGEAGDRGMTDEEIQRLLHMNPSTQRPRRVELVEGGWVEDSKRRRLTYSRREAVVWILSEQGRREWVLLP